MLKKEQEQRQTIEMLCTDKLLLYAYSSFYNALILYSTKV